MGRNCLDVFNDLCGSMHVESDRTEANPEEGKFWRLRYSHSGNYSLLNPRRRFGIRPICDPSRTATTRLYARHYVDETRNDPPVARRFINSTSRCCGSIQRGDKFR